MEKRETTLIGFIFLVLFSLAFGSIAQAAPAQSPTISVSPASMEKSQGDTFTIEIVVDPKGVEIYGAQYDLYFDQNILNATSQSQGTFLSKDGAETIVAANIINNTIGRIEYGESRMGVESGVTNSGVLASISFEVIGTSGTSNLKLSNVILSDPSGEPIEALINSGTCTIVTGAPDTSPAPSLAPTYIDITVEEAQEMLEEDPAQIILLDVRSEGEYNAEHIPGAKLIPLSELENRIDELEKSKSIIVYGKTGGRSRTACEILVQHDFESVYNMLGGMDAWRINFPVSTALTPTPTITVTPSPALSPSPSPTAAASPAASPTPTSTPPSEPGEKWGLPGFEAVFAIIGLLVTSHFVLKRRKRDKK